MAPLARGCQLDASAGQPIGVCVCVCVSMFASAAKEPYGGAGETGCKAIGRLVAQNIIIIRISCHARGRTGRWSRISEHSGETVTGTGPRALGTEWGECMCARRRPLSNWVSHCRRRRRCCLLNVIARVQNYFCTVLARAHTTTTRSSSPRTARTNCTPIPRGLARALLLV